MAIINKIRNYSGLAITFIAISIFAFIAADLLGPGGTVFGGGNAPVVGEINGIKIPYEEFEANVAEIEQNFVMSRGPQAIDDQTRRSFREQAWNNLITKYAFQDQFDMLSVKVPSRELIDMVQGDSLFIHPFVRQQFTNPQTNAFDKTSLIQYLQSLKSQPAQQRLLWENFEKAIAENRQRTKYDELLSLSTYVTEAEAERQYKNQSAKANIKFLYVPFTSIPDSIILPKVTEAQLKAQLNKNPEKYKAEETRSLDYVVFDILPSAQDSADFKSDINQLAQDFMTVPNDSGFAAINTDEIKPFAYTSIKDVDPILFEKNEVVEKGKVYGPYQEGNTYKILKVTDIKEDSAYFVRARHILRKVDKDADAATKAEVRAKANEILQDIKNGADFADMAAQYGEDGTAQRGGDLGFFGKGQMVGPFEEASFARTEAGLLPNLVETDFGFHILDVTTPKSNLSYKIAAISRTLDPSEDTRNEVLLQAEEFRSNVSDLATLQAETEKNEAITLQKADKLGTNATNLGTINAAREVIRWSFNDAEVGDISEVFDITETNQYVIACLSTKSEKDESNIELFREQLQLEAVKELKAEQILKKLDISAKDLEAMADKFGADAQVNTSENITLGTNVLQGAGFNPAAVGKIFSLKKGKRSAPFKDETGVFVLELLEKTAAPKIADYSQYKDQLLQSAKQRIPFLLNQAIREMANVEDLRYKFY